MSRSSKWLFSLVVVVLAASFGLAALAQSTTTSTETKEFTVIEVNGNKVVARTSDGVVKEYTVPAGFMFHVEGKDVTVADLHPGQKGTATITTKVTTTPVTVTEIKEGEVVKATGGNVVIKGPNGLQSFTQGKLDKRGVQIYKNDKLVTIADLRVGDKISATIVTSHPPKIVSERSVKASMVAVPPTPAPMAAAPAAAPAPAAEPAPAPAPVAEAKPKKLPKTASPLPLLALLGSLSAAAGFGMTAVRRLRARG